MFDKPSGTVPQRPVPVRMLTQAELLAAPDNTLYRLGHSTMLIKLGGAFFLTDPVFSERASPVRNISHTELYKDWLRPQKDVEAAAGMKIVGDGA